MERVVELTRRIIIDRSICVGAATCSLAAPKTFGHDDEGYAVLLDGPHDPASVYSDAAQGCPVRAIRLEEIPVDRPKRD